MDSIERKMIGELTHTALSAAALQGGVDTGEPVVKQVPLLRNLLLIFTGVFLVIDLICLFCGQALAATVMLLVLILPISGTGLLSYYNTRIFYDDQGFTIRNFFRIRRRYSYSQVAAGSSHDGGIVDLRLQNGKRIKLDQMVLNAGDFLDHILAFHGGVLPPADPYPVGMSWEELRQSYQNGLFSRALLVPKDQMEAFAPWKKLHRLLSTAAGLCLAGCMIPRINRLFLARTSLILALISLLLYFLRQDFYSARDIPGGQYRFQQVLTPEQKKCHKRAIASFPTLFSFLVCLILSQPHIDLIFSTLTMPSFQVLALVSLGLPMVLLILAYRKYSVEYQRWRLGLVSFSLWALLFSAAFGLYLRMLIHENPQLLHFFSF